MFCGKCGKEVPEGYEFCMGCGAKLEPLTEQVVTFEKETKKKKWVVFVLALVVVVAIGIGVMAVININQKKNGLYNNVAWGTSFEKIQKMVEKNPEKVFETVTNEEKTVVYDSVENFYDLGNVSAMVTYDCKKEKKLQRVTLFIMNGDDSKYTDDMIIEVIEEDFDKLYGEHEEDIIGKVWITKKSRITLTYLSEGCVVLEYEDVTLPED